MEGQYDELIVVDQLWDNLSKKINWGVKQATKDFVVIANDDITLVVGRLKDLCNGDVVSPAVQEGTFKEFHAHCWCVSREKYWKVGGMDEGYDGVYYDDSDMWMRFLKEGYRVEINNSVVISHPHPATTIRTMERKERESDNKQRFISIWGEDALRTTKCV
jgi:hypothetical protein